MNVLERTHRYLSYAGVLKGAVRYLCIPEQWHQEWLKTELYCPICEVNQRGKS